MMDGANCAADRINSIHILASTKMACSTVVALLAWGSIRA